jgi:hypothetical protein
MSSKLEHGQRSLAVTRPRREEAKINSNRPNHATATFNFSAPKTESLHPKLWIEQAVEGEVRGTSRTLVPSSSRTNRIMFTAGIKKCRGTASEWDKLSFAWLHRSVFALVLSSWIIQASKHWMCCILLRSLSASSSHEKINCRAIESMTASRAIIQYRSPTLFSGSSWLLN